MAYVATVTREGDTWLADVAELPGAHAYARTLTRLRSEIADAIIVSADLDDDAKVEVAFELADDSKVGGALDSRRSSSYRPIRRPRMRTTVVVSYPVWSTFVTRSIDSERGCSQITKEPGVIS